MIRQIVGRCHVGESNRQVIRYFISRLAHGYATWAAMDRDIRRQVMASAINIHGDDLDLYHDVVTGQI